MVAEAGNKSRLSNSLLNTLLIETVIGAGGADYILLDHYGTEVVGAAMEGELCGLLADGEPRCLNVTDIIQDKAGGGDYADILKRREVRDDTSFFELRT